MKVQAPYNTSRKRSVRELVSNLYQQRLLHGAPRIAVILIGLQFFWFWYDACITSQRVFKPPRVYVKPTESSPLSPYYNEPYTGPARAFSVWPHPTFPCGPLMPEQDLGARSPTGEGFLFIKEMKTGSTTLSGITARIARNVARRKRAPSPEANAAMAAGDADHSTPNLLATTGDTTSHSHNATVCTARLVHLRARRMRSRLRDKSFLWTVLREPVDRIVSKFFHFAVSREGTPPSLQSLQTYISNNEVTDFGYYFKTLSLRRHINPYRTDLYESFVQELLEGYDFLGVSDRMDESLAVLQLLLGLETQDMLYLSTKTSGSYEWFQQKCVQIQKAHVTMAMKEYFYTLAFESFVEADVFVYKAVNKSLELTIEALGKDRVDKTVQRLQWAQRLAEERCAKVVKFPCSAEGVKQEPNDCLMSDVACGYQCLDQVGQELSDNQEFLQLAA